MLEDWVTDTFIQDKFPERDTTVSAEEQGLLNKFVVTRTDGSSEPGGKHEGCRYFVLDIDHDPHALAALVAYAYSCRDTHPELSDDIYQIAALITRN